MALISIISLWDVPGFLLDMGLLPGCSQNTLRPETTYQADLAARIHERMTKRNCKRTK